MVVSQIVDCTGRSQCPARISCSREDLNELVRRHRELIDVQRCPLFVKDLSVHSVAHVSVRVDRVEDAVDCKSVRSSGITKVRTINSNFQKSKNDFLFRHCHISKSPSYPVRVNRTSYLLMLLSFSSTSEAESK